MKIFLEGIFTFLTGVVYGAVFAYCAAYAVYFYRKLGKVKYSDKRLLDYLEMLNSCKLYTGKCILRMSTTGRGWRLHETEEEGASTSVREAIIKFMKETHRRNK